MKLPGYLIIFVLLTGAALARAEQTIFAGDGLRMVIELVDDKVSGTITLDGERYPFTGVLDGDEIRGEFRADGAAYEFVAKIDGDVVTLESGGETYRLKHEGGEASDENAPGDEQPAPDQIEQPERPIRREEPRASDDDAGPFRVKTDTIVPWLKNNPEFFRMPPPDWMKPGTIITYRSQFASSTRPIRDFSISRDGKIIDHRDITVDLAGTGFSQLRVLGMHDGAVAVSIESLGVSEVPETRGKVSTAGASGYVYAAGAGEEYWLHPEALQHLLKNPAGLDVFPTKHRIGDKTYDAIGIAHNFKTGWFHDIYDARTGVLLTKAYLLGPSKGADDVLMPGDNAQQNTSMARIDFAGIRECPLPWVNPNTPSKIINPGEFLFEGTVTTDMAGLVTQGRLRQEQRVRQAARGWLEVDIQFTTEYPGQPLAQATSTSVIDRARYWIDPKILANLRDREELDSDPVTGYRTIVAGRQGGQIGIVRVSSGEQQDLFYDLRTGDLTMVRFTTVIPGGKQIREYQRTR